MSVSVADRLEEQRQKLLDLTRRNRLLNFRPTRRTTVRVVDELPSELFRQLALAGKTFGFLPDPAQTLPGAGKALKGFIEIQCVGTSSRIRDI